jgi:hypothetical protein
MYPVPSYVRTKVFIALHDVLRTFLKKSLRGPKTVL